MISDSNQLDTLFQRLLDRQPTETEKLRLYRVRDALGLSEGTSMWLLFVVLGHYETLYEAIPERIEAIGNALEAKLTKISSETSAKVLEDARKLCADDLAARTKFGEKLQADLKKESDDAEAAVTRIQEDLLAKINTKATKAVTRVVLSAIRGELQQLREDAGSQSVALEIKNRVSWFESLAFFLYAIFAAGFGVWVWIANPHIALIETLSSLVVGLVLASITVAKPTIARIVK